MQNKTTDTTVRNTVKYRPFKISWGHLHYNFTDDITITGSKSDHFSYEFEVFLKHRYRGLKTFIV